MKRKQKSSIFYENYEISQAHIANWVKFCASSIRKYMNICQNRLNLYDFAIGHYDLLSKFDNRLCFST